MKFLICLLLMMLSLLSALRATRPFARQGLTDFSKTILRAQGHQVASNAPELTPEEEKIVATLKENQANAKRISYAEEVRTLIAESIGFGTLSTNSQEYEGFPTGAVVGFHCQENGLPFFVFSSMSEHRKNVEKDGRCSLTVMAKDFKGAAQGRVVLVGNVKKVTNDEQKAKLRDEYLKRHELAYWIDFGDFAFFSMESLQAVRFVGGFAMAGDVSPADYMAARPDPLRQFATPVMSHMNDDHADAIIAMVQHYAGVPCTEASIVGLDRLGMTVKATIDVQGGVTSKVRLPFPEEVTERHEVKKAIVEMTKASAATQE